MTGVYEVLTEPQITKVDFILNNVKNEQRTLTQRCCDGCLLPLCLVGICLLLTGGLLTMWLWSIPGENRVEMILQRVTGPVVLMVGLGLIIMACFIRERRRREMYGLLSMSSNNNTSADHI